MAHPERLVVGPSVQPRLPPAAGGGRAAARRRRRRRWSGRPPCTAPSACVPLVLSTEIDGFVADRLLEALWREALWLVDGRRRHRRGDRRCHPLRRRAPLELHGDLPHLPHRRRRGRHAPLHGPVRPGAAVAVDPAGRRPGADGGAARPHRHPVRRPGRRAVGAGAGGAAGRRTGRGPAGPAEPSGSGPERCSTTTSGRCSSGPASARQELLDGRPLAGGRADRADGVGRLQRPHQRQPVPGAVEQRRSTPSCASSGSTPRTWPRAGSYFTVESHLTYRGAEPRR